MACAGLGIPYCPLRQAYRALEDGRLLRAQPDWRDDARDIYAPWPQQPVLPASAAFRNGAVAALHCKPDDRESAHERDR